VSRLKVVLCALVVLVGALGGASVAGAASTELLFSEYVEGSSNNKALEIFNGTGAPVDLGTAEYNVQVFFNGSRVLPLTIGLTGTVASNDVYVLAHASSTAAILAQADQTTGSGWFNGDDAVVLRRGTTIVDSIGQTGFDPGTEWGSSLQSTADNTLRRKASISAGDTNNLDAFVPSLEWDGFANDTFGGLGSHLTPAVSCPQPTTLVAGYTTASLPVSASDPDGRVASLTGSVSPAPAAGSIALTGVAPAAAAGGSATGTVEVSGAVPVGDYVVTISAATDDATPQTGACSFTVKVDQIRSIGEVQGSVLTGPGIGHRSSFAPPAGGSVGRVVAIRGVIFERTLARTSAGGLQNGFFIQNTAATADGDDTTSDGIFVFIGSQSAIPGPTGLYTPKVGDEIVLTGGVTEFFNFTELSNPRLVNIESSGVLALDAAVPAFDADPPADNADAGVYWERREGMRGSIPAGARATDGLDHFPSTADTEMWVIRGDNPLNDRFNPFARRVFRDAHPLDDQPGLADNGNGFRILVSSYGVRGASGNSLELLSPSRTFDRIQNELVGGVYVSFDKYSIATAAQPRLQHSLVKPEFNFPPTKGKRAVEYSVGDYNVENLYDYRDDPNDGCDFVGNAGCPGVSPPFDYVPASDAVYQERLGLIAEQIVDVLHAPDVILVQEAEDQDICSVVAGVLTCGAADDADGKPDTLQELALRIGANRGVGYDAAYDRDGADDRGIVAALMYRTDRVELVVPSATDPVLGSSPALAYSFGSETIEHNAYNADVQNPKSLNAALPDVDASSGVDGNEIYTRDPQVGAFRIWRTVKGVGDHVDVWAISNHFSSTPDRRRAQRHEQAAYLAAIVNAIDSDRIVAGGDFNVFPRPDDPVVPASDQLGPLYDAAGLHNLWDTLAAQLPWAAYSYVFVGQAQTLDGQFVTPELLAELRQTRVAHVNADYPADFAGDGARGLSDHDPMASRFSLGTPTHAGLKALLTHYCTTGAIASAKTCARLQQQLDKAAGRPSKLDDFIDEVDDASPRSLPKAVADALIAEAAALLGRTRH
jgi:predicted extracellular nuclease